MTASPAALASQLLRWYGQQHRSFPWRGSTDAYRVWVSEVMLQQTRTAVVARRYEPFLQRFPTVEALAAASQEEVLAQWAGLGYYRRARSLHSAAGRIVSEHRGRVPGGLGALRRLPGIGDYTAAAIASIAFDQPVAALDGNALRVLARLSDERRPVHAGAGRAALAALADAVVAAVPRGARGDFTQALIDLGATVCVARTPSCGECPWQASCAAFSAGSAASLPARPPRRPPRRVRICAGLAVSGDRILLCQRPPNASVMPGFWELPQAAGARADLLATGLAIPDQGEPLCTFQHAITDRVMTVRVFRARPAATSPRPARWLTLREAGRLPLSTIARKAIVRCMGPESSQEPARQAVSPG